MAAIKKTFVIKKIRRGTATFIEGTLEYLINYFSYTLECGHSWNYKINKNPKTIKGLVKALDQSVQETQGGCYNQDSYYESSIEEKAQYEASLNN